MMVIDGFTINCMRMIPYLSLQLGNYEVKDDFFVVIIGEINIVMGIQWLHSLGEITLNF